MLLRVRTHHSIDHQRSIADPCSCREWFAIDKKVNASVTLRPSWSIGKCNPGCKKQTRRWRAPDCNFTKLIEWQVPESWLYPVTAMHTRNHGTCNLSSCAWCIRAAQTYNSTSIKQTTQTDYNKSSKPKRAPPAARHGQLSYGWTGGGHIRISPMRGFVMWGFAEDEHPCQKHIV